MPDNVAMRTAARELGLKPKLLELAAQVGEIRTVRGAAGGPLRVPHEEVGRLKATEGFPDSFRERLRVVDAAGGAQLLGIGVARFARLARGGCFSPARFYVNRYRTVVWLYLARELRAFAQRRPELLTGSAPRGLRVLLEEGVDFRPRHWRGRRVGQLCRQADGPWEAAAARAAVLDAGTLEQAVPDPRERARLVALAPELTALRGASAATREVAEALCVATEEDEVLWHRLMLEADLEDARARDSRPEPSEPSPERAAAAPDSAASASTSAAASTQESGCRVDLARRPPAPRPGRPPVPSGGAAPGRRVRPAERGSCTGADQDGRRRRADMLSRLRGPRLRPAWWRRERDLSRPAF